MADFDEAIKNILLEEGGIEDSSSDPGGFTRFGISLRFYQKNIKLCADKGDILDLTIDDAKAIYRKYFWEKNKYNLIANQKVAQKVFDLCVNCGAEHANEMLQHAVNSVNPNKPLIETDGIMGTQTLRAVNYSPPEALYLSLKVEGVIYYESLVKKNPHLAPFLRGWINRAQSDI